MAIGIELLFTDLNQLNLDPVSSRIRRHQRSRKNSQVELLQIMRAWALEELANSYLQNGGFWLFEPMIVVREKLYGEQRLVVVEGNRRLAALKALRQAVDGYPPSRKWSEISDQFEVESPLFSRIPYVVADSRRDLSALHGFRHVSGIKRWDAEEKAVFISYLIEKEQLTYQQVARTIGSDTPTVRKHYIAYRILIQAEDEVQCFDAELANNRFSILYFLISTTGVQDYLNLSLLSDPQDAQRPIPFDRLVNLSHFCRWAFGTRTDPPVLFESEDLSELGSVLDCRKAVTYLETAKQPQYNVALQISADAGASYFGL